MYLYYWAKHSQILTQGSLGKGILINELKIILSDLYVRRMPMRYVGNHFANIHF